MRSPLASRLAAGLGCTLLASLTAGLLAMPAAAENDAPAPSESPSPSSNATPTGPDTGSTPAGTQAPSPTATASPSASPSALPAPAPVPGPRPVEKAPAKKSALSISDSATGASVAAGSAGKAFSTTIANTGDAAARSVVVTIDATELDPTIVTVTFPPSGCTIAARVARCAAADLAPGADRPTPPVTLRPAPGAEPGTAGTLTVSVAGSDDNGAAAYFTVDLAPAGVDLAVAAHDLVATPGSTAPLRFSVTNSGDETAETVTLFVGLPSYTTFASTIDGCRYHDGRQSMECELTGVNLKPGEALDATDVSIAVSAVAPGPLVIGDGTVYAGSMASEARTSVAARPSGLRFVRRAAGEYVPDVDDRDNQANFRVRTTANPSDFAALGARVAGKRGAVVQATVGQVNRGPADSDAVGPGWGNRLVLTAPAGTEIVRAPSRCQALVAKRKYACEPDGSLKVNQRVDWIFALKVTGATVGADGTVTVDGGALDVNRANNTAKLHVTLLATSGTSGGTLPDTGAKIGMALGAGAALVLLGAVLLVFGRRPTRN